MKKTSHPVDSFKGLITGDIRQNLFKPLQGEMLAVFRILFGITMLVEVVRYFRHGWIARYWIDPHFHFTYFPFDFLQPLPGQGMYYLFIFLGVLSVCIAVGFLYRISSVLFFLSFSYVFLLEQTRYLNHFYLIVLIAFVMMFIPLHRKSSLDSKLFVNLKDKDYLSWHLWLVRFMIFVPYFWGGVAKINPDWLSGHPMDQWVGGKTDIPIFGPFLDEHWMIVFISISGMLLDLLIVPFLLWKRTRLIAYLAIAIFHITNAQWFQIGIFPWFMLGATLMFFPHDVLSSKSSRAKNKSRSADVIKPNNTVIAMLAIWIVIHTFLPLRHWLYPGNVNWTEEGHRFAWHMKLRSKQGKGFFRIVDLETGEQFSVKPKDILSPRQARKIKSRPYLIWQTAHKIKKHFKEFEGREVAVYAHIRASLNGRPYQPLINPDVDLASVPRPVFGHSEWIVPLSTEIPEHKR